MYVSSSTRMDRLRRELLAGGKGKETNGTFHVPICDWYGTADNPPKCSGFYHVSVCPWC